MSVRRFGAGPAAGRDRRRDQGGGARPAGHRGHRWALAARGGAGGRHDRPVALPLLRQPRRAAQRAGHRLAPRAGRRRGGRCRRPRAGGRPGCAGSRPPARSGSGRWRTRRRSCCSTAPRCPASTPAPRPRAGARRCGSPGRSPTCCSTGGRPPSSPPSRCPRAARPLEAVVPDGALPPGRARAVHRAARAHARAGDAGAPRPPVAVRGRRRAVLHRRHGTACPTSSTRCRPASEARRRCRKVTLLRLGDRKVHTAAGCRRRLASCCGPCGTSSRRRGAGARAGCRWPRACRWSARSGSTGRSAPGG